MDGLISGQCMVLSATVTVNCNLAPEVIRDSCLWLGAGSQTHSKDRSCVASYSIKKEYSSQCNKNKGACQLSIEFHSYSIKSYSNINFPKQKSKIYVIEAHPYVAIGKCFLYLYLQQGLEPLLCVHIHRMILTTVCMR